MGFNNNSINYHQDQAKQQQATTNNGHGQHFRSAAQQHCNFHPIATTVHTNDNLVIRSSFAHGFTFPPNQMSPLSALLTSLQPYGGALMLQDVPFPIEPVFNGVNPNYPGLRLVNANPPLFAIDNFLTPMECDYLIHCSKPFFTPAPVVGPGSGEVSPSRTSSTCYLAREDLPTYMTKISLLTGCSVLQCELPQVGEYLPSQQYMQHFDAFDLSNEDGRRFAMNGGQRIVTVLTYLNDVPSGGCTSFPNLGLKVKPQKGTALVFFPSTMEGLLDARALHAAEPAIDTKYVSQVWIRQTNYEGKASIRLHQPM